MSSSTKTSTKAFLAFLGIVAILAGGYYLATLISGFSLTMKVLTAFTYVLCASPFTFYLRSIINTYNATNDALLRACEDGDYLAAETALKNGANVNYTTSANFTKGHLNTPLHLVCASKRSQKYPEASVRLAELLLAHGANPRAINGEGNTPLLEAAEIGFHQIFSLFKDHAVANVLSKKHKTPLMVVIEQSLSAVQKRECVKALLDINADPNLRCQYDYDLWRRGNNKEGTVLHRLTESFADKVRHNSTDDLTIFVELCRLLLAKRANPLAVMHQLTNPHAKNAVSSIELMEPRPANFAPGHADLYNSILHALEDAIKDQNRKFNAKEFAKVTSAEGLKAGIKNAMFLQKCGQVPNALPELTTAFFENDPPNNDGLNLIQEQIKPRTSGFAHFHKTLAYYYFEGAGTEFDAKLKASGKTAEGDPNHFKRNIHLLDQKAQDEINNLRRLAFKHCLLGLQSEEKDSESKKDNVGLLAHLLQKLCQEWGLENALSVQNVEKIKPEEDILNWTANTLLQSAYAKAPAPLAEKPGASPAIPVVSPHLDNPTTTVTLNV